MIRDDADIARVMRPLREYVVPNEIGQSKLPLKQSFSPPEKG
jgi:hypothetical protein